MAETFQVRLAHHRVGFYDPLNHLHLSKGLREEAEVSASLDLRHIRSAVKSGALLVVAGVLPEEVEQATATVDEPVVQTKEADTATDESTADSVTESKEAPAVKSKGGKKRG